MVANTPQAWDLRARAGTPWEAALWSRRSQQRRFVRALSHVAPRRGEVLLDFGCGQGALAGYVPEQEYVGVDWSPEMRAVCQERGLTVHSEAVPADVVVAIGPFNLRDNWWKERTWDTIESLWTFTRRVMAVSLYRGSDPACLSYSMSDAVALAARLDVERSLIDVSYLPNDLMVVLWRDW